MEDLLVLGLDIHALEVIDIINAVGKYRVIGIISHRDNYPPSFEGYPVLGGEEKLKDYPSAKRLPLHVWKDMRGREQWVSIIAPTAFVASTANIGAGCIIYPNCFVGAKAELSDGVFMLAEGVINHDCVIGEKVTVTSRATLAGYVKVGDRAYLGQGCLVKQYLTVGKDSIVGMGAVVTRDVPDNTTVIGCPARPYIK